MERCRSCFQDECLEPLFIDQDVYYVCRKCNSMMGVDDTIMTVDDCQHCKFILSAEQKDKISGQSTMTNIKFASTETHWSPRAERCPSCFEDECLKPVNIDQDIYYACRCGYMTGVDDTMTNDDLLLAFLAACSFDDCSSNGDARSLLKVKIVVCAGCGNDDINLLSIVACDKATGNVSLQCLICDEKMAVSINPNSNDELGEENSYSKCAGAAPSDLSEAGYSVYDDDKVFDDSEFDSLSSSFDVCEEPDVERLTSLTCSRCANQTVELFDIELNQVTGELMTTQCHACCCIDIHNDLSTLETPTSIFLDDVEDSSVTRHSYVECTHCGNARDDLFSIKFDDDGNRMLSVKCLACSQLTYLDGRHRTAARRQTIDAVKINENNTRAVHHHWSIQGRAREHRLSRRSQRGGAAIGRERISTLDRLRRGDHISWHKWYAIWHHAIVLEVDADHGRLTVIHNSGSVKPLDGKLASVRLETIDVDPVREDLYRYVYHSRRDPDGSDSPCYLPDEVVLRAASRLGQTYNPFTFNCEHFARWCKAGRNKSAQVTIYFSR